MNSELRYWLWLTMAFGAASPEKWNFMAKYDSVVSAYKAIARGDFRHVLPKDKKRVEAASLEDADKLIEYSEEKGISVCGYSDSEYPDRLREIYNPPSVLFYVGDIGCIDKSIVISCVGTRNPSEYSISVCTKICTDLVKSGVILASGLQVGMDSLAHNAALSAGGKTIAVVPCGLLYDYPKGSEALKKAIGESGLVISEYFPDEKASRLTFRARNRILSGISLGTLIMQAGKTSGALSTAGFAISQGRDIFCIPPHELFNDDYSGVVNLIRDGAIPVFDARDVLNEYYSMHAHKLNPAYITALKSESGIFAAEKSKQSRQKKAKDAQTEQVVEEAVEPSIPDFDISSFTEDERAIFEYISANGVVSVDELENEFSELEDLVSVLSSLEVFGAVKPLPGERYSI